MGFEVVKIMLLVLIAVEIFLLIYKKETENIVENKVENKSEKKTRRDVYGTFGNPLGDSYRKNSRGQLKPVYPGTKFIKRLGDDEEDEV